jgi:hypothetical protein
MDLAAFAQLAATLSREQFLARVSGIFLAVATTPGPLTLGFRTEYARPAVQPQRGTLSAVYPVVKAKGNPYPERISLGRAPNCDIVLRVASVSKLHAHFLVKAGLVKAGLVETGLVKAGIAKGGWRGSDHDLVDLGSHNGTRVNGSALTPQQAVPVGVGDLLQFGEVTAELIDAETLHAVLKSS